ncbi:MAG: universal stress protein [Gammaproteobacteria bacterium]
MKRFKNILFVADRQDGLTAALDRAVAVSQTNAARLTVMDVTPEAGIADFVKQNYAVDLDAEIRQQRLEALEALVQPYTAADVPVYTKVTTGIAFLEVVRAVLRNGHDLVMKVAQYDTGLAPWLFGSTDMHLLRKCPCPVWIDHTDGAPAYRRLLAAVDPFDDESGDLQRLILDLATSLAEREQATLDVVHAWELPGESMLTSGRGRIPRSELDRMLEETEQRHREALDTLLSPHSLSSAADNVHLVKGRPARIISAYARQQRSDLIVMGTLGRAGIPGLIIGNTAEDVLRQSQTAVLAVKPGSFVSPVTC